MALNDYRRRELTPEEQRQFGKAAETAKVQASALSKALAGAGQVQKAYSQFTPSLRQPSYPSVATTPEMTTMPSVRTAPEVLVPEEVVQPSELPMMNAREPISTGPVTLSNAGVSGDWQGLRSQIMAARNTAVPNVPSSPYTTSFRNSQDQQAFERTPAGPTGTQLVPSQRQWYGAGTGLRGAEPTARSLEDMTLGELFVTGLGTRVRRSEVLNQTAMEQNALMARGQDINLATAAVNAEQARITGQAQAEQQQREFALDVADKASLGSLRQAQAEQARRGRLVPITVEEPTGEVDKITGAPITIKKQYLYNSDTKETIDPQANTQSGAPAVPSQVAIDEMTKAKQNNAPNLKEMEAEYLATFGALPY